MARVQVWGKKGPGFGQRVHVWGEKLRFEADMFDERAKGQGFWAKRVKVWDTLSRSWINGFGWREMVKA